MYITFDPATGDRALRDPEDFTAFSVLLPAGTPLPLGPSAVLDELGSLTEDGGHVFVRQDAALDLAGAAERDEEWRQSWSAMVAHAQKAGWVSPDGTAIRAHVAVSEGCDSPT